MDTNVSHARPVRPSAERVAKHGWVSIRPIDRSDASALSEFYARLSPESRRRRFLSSGGPSPEVISRLTASPGLVGVLHQEGSNDGAVVAHAVVLPDRRGTAEVAFAVADEVQHRGVGRRLVGAAFRLARELGYRRASATILMDNVVMRRLLNSDGVDVLTDFVDDGTEELTVDLATAR